MSCPSSYRAPSEVTHVQTLRCFSVVVLSLAFALSLSARADTYTQAIIGTDSLSLAGINSAGQVLIFTGCEPPNTDCYNLYTNGVITQMYASFPSSFVPDDGAKCTGGGCSGGGGCTYSGPGAPDIAICNGAWEVVEFFPDPNVVLEFGPGTSPSGDLVPVAGGPAFPIFLSSNGDFLYNTQAPNYDVAESFVTVTTPDLPPVALIATGLVLLLAFSPWLPKRDRFEPGDEVRRLDSNVPAVW